jgi:hypothetical protein
MTLFRAAGVLTVAITLTPNPTLAQEADTLTISGQCNMDGLGETVGEDLAEVFAQGGEHSWRLTLHGVSLSYDFFWYAWSDEFGDYYEEQRLTGVQATSFDFQFFGPDAEVLNDVVSQQLTTGIQGGDVFLELWNNYAYNAYRDGGYDEWWYGQWDIGVHPADPAAGVSFVANGLHVFSLFPADEYGFPVLTPQRVSADVTVIQDRRPGNFGTLTSSDDSVDIGSPEPPYVPPTLSIDDASVQEGHRGTTYLKLTVMLSRYPDDVVTVDFQTADGTAKKKSDYTAASGTLLFWPDQISQVISIAIKTDRKRESNETFSVRLSNAVRAAIDDGTATATILNDD